MQLILRHSEVSAKGQVHSEYMTKSKLRDVLFITGWVWLILKTVNPKFHLNQTFLSEPIISCLRANSNKATIQRDKSNKAIIQRHKSRKCLNQSFNSKKFVIQSFNSKKFVIQSFNSKKFLIQNLIQRNL